MNVDKKNNVLYMYELCSTLCYMKNKKNISKSTLSTYIN